MKPKKGSSWPRRKENSSMRSLEERKTRGDEAQRE